ncbi:LysR family transcriptional regulator [Rhizobium leguminosarum bv. viciae]|nr:LysR family transcriptional regulator [Rhizobium ruizarguesonis]TBA33512.1 LysR family transcriptional regulator [Rhizobium ruizarguesonis]TBA35061.1 LysR family transcriptional regulator [Rhizobium ruizarguesonis]TCA28598.1 LysR family transcriptional regulator [Rhizobium leguminosarum bv. viciae]
MQMVDFVRQLDWNLLHTFMVVAQERSMTRAADVMHRTQPAISQGIKRLEETAGTKLLERSRSGLIPTPAGEMLLEQVRSIFATISRLPVGFEAAPAALSGRLKIAMIDQVVNETLDRALTSFFARYPGVDLEITVSTTAAIIRAVELGHCTFGISDGVIPDFLASRELMRERFGLFCGAIHRLAGRKDLNVAQLRAEPFIGFTADVLGGTHMGDVTAYRASASIGQRVRGQSSYVSEIRRMIECGLGIGFLPLHLAEPYVDQGKLWRLPPYRDEPCAAAYVVTNPQIGLSVPETLFLKELSKIDFGA